MELTWNKGYEDYEDAAWQDRLRILENAWQSISLEDAEAIPTDRLLDHMEQMEELMRYYTAAKDFRSLEPLMRSYEPMLENLRNRGTDLAGYWYLEMEYARLNALLYLDQGSNQQARNYYEQALTSQTHCFARLREEEGQLEQIQRLYLSWACAECRNEFSFACERMLDSEKMYTILTGSIPLLQYIETQLGDGTGICEKTAEVYARTGSVCYPVHDFVNGDFCYERAKGLFDDLADELDSDFYRARGLWVYGMHGIDAYAHAGRADVMLECEKEAEIFLQSGAAGRDRAIAQGVQALVFMQRSGAIQQSGGDLHTAIDWSQRSIDLFVQARQVLEKDMETLRSSMAKHTISDIAARLYNGCVSAMEVLGVQYYAAERWDDAADAFERVLSMLSDNADYTMAERGSIVLRAESCEYLALLYADKGDGYKADFYGSQALEFAETAARKMQNPMAWQIAVVSASIAAEVAARMKDKMKMGTYAERGIAACDELAKTDPGNQILSMRTNLEKWLKKSKRRFF